MLTNPTGWTADDLDLLPDDGNRYEVVAGELFVTPAPRRDHQAVSGEFYTRLSDFAKAARIGRVFFAPGDVHFDARNCVRPDIFVEPRRTFGRPKSWRDAPAPILIVEFLSDSTADRDMGPKRDLYRRAGIAEYWIVDIENRLVRVVRPGEPDGIAHSRIVWRPAGVAEALAIDLAALFREALDD